MRVLVLGTNRPCHDSLLEQGHEVVLLIQRGKALAEDLSKGYAHIALLHDDAPDAAWHDVAAALHRHGPFDAVAAFNDRSQALAHGIALKLDVPTAIDLELLNLVTDKSQMRAALDKHGIPSCRHAFATGADRARAAIGEIGFPCIIKPVDGEASIGVAKVSQAGDVDEALAWVGEASLERGVIIEEFLVGEEYSVEAITARGTHHILAITKKYKDARNFVEVGHQVPAPLEAQASAEIERYVKRILSAFGYRDCPSHTELMLTASGPRIIETHTRVGGDRIVDLVRHATGVDLYGLVAKQSLGFDVTADVPTEVTCLQSAAVWYANPSVAEDLLLDDIRGADNVRKQAHIKTLDLLKKPGSRGARVRHSFDRSALAIAVGHTPAEAVDRAKDAIRRLHFIYRGRSDPDLAVT